ncbi:MAG TPA: hypothetical protein PLP29_06995 [Candidatus Ozemobacteraceae bacterium]|nr:hypothetical protein [Candidatus Ozemobacteraceae bacterium]
MSVLLLEDNESRIRRFEKLGLNVLVCRNAFEAIARLYTHRDTIRLISLDHDLTPRENACGSLGIACACHVVDLLCVMPTFCPVMIHTSNEQAAALMKHRLVSCGWPVIWVKTDAPFPDDWIETLWKEAVRSAGLMPS